MANRKNLESNDSMIHARALLVWLNIRTWSARKYDRKVSAEVNQKYAASTDAGRYNKFLLPGDCPDYHTLITLASSFRAWHYSQTLAWSDEGWRLLPTANYDAYMAEYRKRIAEVTAARDRFVAQYPMMREQARRLLNGLYKDEDYPHAIDIGNRFGVDLKLSPLPNFWDVRVELPKDSIEEIEAGIQDQIAAAVKVATRDAWERLHDVVSKISEKLGQPDAIFRNSLIENAIETCDALRRLNVTNDPELERMRAKVAADLTTFDPDILRDTKAIRARVASKADQILRDMSSMIGAA